MAQDPLAMVYGGQIGQGQAQVFDTSGLAKQVAAQKQQKDKAFLDSILDLDTSKVWSNDLPEYNKMWSNYRNFVSKNYKKLSNPARNVDVWSEKKRMEQEMLNFVATSNSQHKQYVEYSKAVRDTDKWVQTVNKETGRFLSDEWANMPLSQRSTMSIWDTRTKKLQDIGDIQMKRNNSLKSSTITKTTEEVPIDPNDLSAGSTTQTKSDVDMQAWDRGVANFYNQNANYAARIDQNYEEYKAANADSEGNLYMPFTYWDEDENIEKTEDMLIENGLQYDIVTSRANLPKGAIKNTYSVPAQYNLRTFVSVNTQKEGKWDISGESDTYRSKSSSYVQANQGVGVTVYPMRYDKGTRPFMASGGEFQGKIISNFGGDFTGATMPSNATFDGFYKDDNGIIGFSISMPSKVIESKLNKSKSNLSTKERELQKVKKDNPQIIKDGKVVANPKIKTLESEIYKLNKEIEKYTGQSGQAQRLMIPVIDGRGQPINLSILSVSGLPSTIEEIEKIVGKRGSKVNVSEKANVL
tara:strand:- start:10349 stop:11923 length:1575 start_codon:yes stop_codon:yes gene_type:complete